MHRPTVCEVVQPEDPPNSCCVILVPHYYKRPATYEVSRSGRLGPKVKSIAILAKPVLTEELVDILCGPLTRAGPVERAHSSSEMVAVSEVVAVVVVSMVEATHMSRHDQSFSDQTDGDLQSKKRGTSTKVVYHGRLVQRAQEIRLIRTYRSTGHCSSSRL